MNDSLEVLDGVMGKYPNNKIHIIYNESNYSDFTKFDKSKIFLVFSKLNENQYKFELQHVII